MGGVTFLIGLLPTYETIGIWAPVLLTVPRFFQGLAADTRERVLCDCIARDALLMPGHFMVPHAMRGNALSALTADPGL